jgi:DNA-binding transcriptional LysR family regulator
MGTPRQEITSLSALFALEAAGRLSSFTLAARELGVTQAAVSKQIAMLEADLRTVLFFRKHREVQLTEKGLELFRVTTKALSAIGSTMKDIRGTSRVRPVTIAATMTNSHFWLLPRLPEFRKRHPDVAIRILSQEEPVDLKDGAIDMAIRFGDGNWNDGAVTSLFEGVVYAMASPGFLAARPELTAVEDVLRCPLIAYDAPDPTWVSWSDWLAGTDMQVRLPTPALSCTRYIDAVQAACADQGIVLVWGGVTGGVEERGALVRVPGPQITPEGAFCLVLPKGGLRSSDATLFSEWLLGEAEVQRQKFRG